MTLPASPNLIAMGDTSVTLVNGSVNATQSVNKELRYAAPYLQTRSLNDSLVRSVFGVPSGTIQLGTGRGKSYNIPMSSIAHTVPNQHRIGIAGKEGTTWYGPWYGYYPLIGHPRWPDTASIDNGALFQLPVGAWYNNFTVSIYNNNDVSQKVNLQALAFCGIWDTCNCHIYRVSPSQVYIGGVNSGHVPDWNIYDFWLNTTDIIPPWTTYQYRVYMDSSYNGDYKYNRYAGGIKQFNASHHSFV